MTGVNFLHNIESLRLTDSSIRKHPCLCHQRQSIIVLASNVSAWDDLPRLTREIGEKRWEGMFFEGRDVWACCGRVNVVVKDLLGIGAGDTITLDRRS
jgi:hypothetical protein